MNTQLWIVAGLVSLLAVYFYLAWQGSRPYGKHAVRDDLLARSMTPCVKCARDIHVFAEACRHCAAVQKPDEVPTLRFSVANARVPVRAKEEVS